jgi:hypothetical protein
MKLVDILSTIGLLGFLLGVVTLERHKSLSGQELLHILWQLHPKAIQKGEQ